MSKQYMTIQFGDRTATVKTNSEKAIKNALGKLRIHNRGTVVSFVIKGDVIEFEGTQRKASWGYWEPTTTYRARIIENTFVTEETAEVVEVATEETAEVITAYTMDTDDTTYAVDAAEVAAWLAEETAEVVEAPATEEHTVTMSVEEKRAAWDIFVKEWAKSRAAEIHAIRAAEAKTVNA
jgi:hypothetical protein